jgi:hypothetical protein
MAVSVKTDVVLPCRADRARVQLQHTLGVAEPTRRRDGRTSIATLSPAHTGRADRLLPSFDTSVAVTAIDDTSCLMTIAGTYEPPFGRFGALLDRTVMHGLAASTTVEFADRLARALGHKEKEGPR